MTILALPDPAGYSLVNGLQIVPSAAYCVTAPTNLVSLWQGEGNTWDSWSGGNTAGEYDISYLSGQIGEAFWFDGAQHLPPRHRLRHPQRGHQPHRPDPRLLAQAPGPQRPSPDRVEQRHQLRGVFLDVQRPLRQFRGHQRHQPCRLLAHQHPFHELISIRRGHVRRQQRRDLSQWNQRSDHQPGQLHPQTSYNAYFGYLSAPGLGTNYYYGLLDEPQPLQTGAHQQRGEHPLRAGAASNSVCAMWRPRSTRSR